MKKKLVLAMAATMAITSCAVPVLADDAAAEGGKIGISMPTQSLERWNRDGSYLEEQFKAAGYDVELTYSDNETDRQVNDIQNLISDGVNLLVIAAIDGEALNTVMDEAADAVILDFLNPNAFSVPICILSFFTTLVIVVITDKIAINRNNPENIPTYVSPSSISP